MMKSFGAIVAGLATLPLAAYAQNSSLPIVNLGYERHQAIRLEQASGAYNFSNIRFGQAPVGDLRFRAPLPAWNVTNSSQINNGSIGRVCPQTVPLWQNITADYAASLSSNQTFNQTQIAQGLYGNQTALDSIRVSDPRENEDCLFLDVVVPQTIYNNASKGYGAPVLLWIFGGGYVEGDKAETITDPTGLFSAARDATGEEFIWVAINYRLGAFGWLAGPTLSANGTPNAALYDQRLALDWVERYIHLFGGDASRVTLMGESAGGGSIMHQITAFNGEQGTKFSQAIPQSPGWFPIVSSYDQEQTFNQLLEYANVTSLSELRSLSTEDLQQANFLQVANSEYGTFTYGPVVDGVIAPQLPGRALLSGGFDPNLRLLLGHNADEGFDFSRPNITTDDEFNSFISSYFTGSNTELLDEITKVLYPPVYDGSFGYKNDFERTDKLVSESVFTCNTFYMAKAFQNQTHNYQFSVPPALHGFDVNFTFSADPKNAQVPIVASALQQYITTFVINGVPSNVNNRDLPEFPVYGNNATLLNLNSTISTIKDSNAGPQCDFWQKALYG